MLLSIIFGWLAPCYLYIGMFTLLIGMIIDGISEFGWKQTAQFILAWPVIWFVVVLLKHDMYKNKMGSKK